MRKPHAADPANKPPLVRCAIYTRKSTEEGLEQEFNSLDAQRESAEAYVRSQAGQGWALLPQRYDDLRTAFPLQKSLRFISDSLAFLRETRLTVHTG